MGLEKSDLKTYAIILSSNGSIRVKTDASNPDAVLRKYELRDGTKGEKYELVYSKLSGKTNDLIIYEGKYGEQLSITLDEVILQMPLDSSYCTDLMSKLPSLDLEKEITLNPYSFEADNGKIKKGISIVQGQDDKGEDIKIQSYFFDGKKSINGIPEAPSKEMTTKKWQIHFLKVSEWLREYTEKNIIPNIVREDEDQIPLDDLDFNKDEEVKKEDIPK